jgi:hypothetical protein
VESGCEEPLDCEAPPDVKLIQLRGPEAEQTMRELCERYPRGVTGALFVEETGLKALELPCLCSLSGSLLIRDNPKLVELGGLAHIEHLEGSLTIVDNPALRTLVGLPKRATLDPAYPTSLEIRNNDALRDLTGLPIFTDAPGPVTITNNDALERLTGLPPSLPHVGGLAIAGNPALVSLAELPRDLATVDGTLRISVSQGDASELPRTLTRVGKHLHLNGFRSFQEFPPIAEVGEDLSILGNAVTDLTGFPDGLVVGGGLTIANNPLLDDLAGLPRDLTVGGSLKIEWNDGLVDLSGLPDGLQIGVDEQTGISIAIDGNDQLERLTGLPESLTAVPGTVLLRDNPRLRDLGGLFDHLRAVGGELMVVGNQDLRDLGGIPEGTTLGVGIFGHTLRVEGNERLERLTGLPQSLTWLPGTLSVVDNPALVDLTGLEGIEGIDGDLLIGRRTSDDLGNPYDWSFVPAGNLGLQSLAGLSGLTEVGGILGVTCNPGLVDLASLGQLASVGYLLLLDNPELAGLGELGGPGGALHSVGSYQIRCSPKLDPAAAAAVLAEVAESVPTSIELMCE